MVVELLLFLPVELECRVLFYDKIFRWKSTVDDGVQGSEEFFDRRKVLGELLHRLQRGPCGCRKCSAFGLGGVRGVGGCWGPADRKRSSDVGGLGIVRGTRPGRGQGNRWE